MVRSFTLCVVCVFKWLILQCPANSITSRMQMMNVCSSLVPLHFQTTRSARMEQSTGMNGHLTDKSRTRPVRGVIDLIMAKPIVVLDSALKGFCSGSSSYYCRLDSRGWWLTITSAGVELQEGAFFLSSSSILRVIFFCIRTIRLPGEVNRPAYGGDTGVIATLASVPWFIIGVTGIAYEWVVSRLETTFRTFRQERSGYRDVPIDEDAQILRFEDEES
jgi:hypothetical protein